MHGPTVTRRRRGRPAVMPTTPSSSSASRARPSCSSWRTRSRVSPSSRPIVSSGCCSPPKPKRSSRIRRSVSGSLRERCPHGLVGGGTSSASSTGSVASRVCEQVAELAVAVVADRLVERHRSLDGAERLLDVLELEPCRLGELLVRRLAALLGFELVESRARASPGARGRAPARGSSATGSRSRAGRPGGSTRSHRSRT